LNKRLFILENEPFSTNLNNQMSGIKRAFIAEECSATPNDNNLSLIENNVQPSSPSDSPQSKKLRRSSSHHTTESENDDETQDDPYEQENGITNGTEIIFFEKILISFKSRSFASSV
jgi:hypothetical protein